MPYGPPYTSTLPAYSAEVALPNSGFQVSYTGNQDAQTEAQRDAEFQGIVDFLNTMPGALQVSGTKHYQTTVPATPTQP